MLWAGIVRLVSALCGNEQRENMETSPGLSHIVSSTAVAPARLQVPSPSLVRNAALVTAEKPRRSLSSVLPWSVADKRTILRRSDKVRARRCRRDQRAEKALAQQLPLVGHPQTVVIGKPPEMLPEGPVFVVSRDELVVFPAVHVRCEAESEEWTMGLTLSGFNWRRRTTWVLHMEDAKEDELARQLRAVAMMSEARSTVLLTSWSTLAAEVAKREGFYVEVGSGCQKPLVVLRWYGEEDRSTQHDADGAESSGSVCSGGGGLQETLVTFELEVEGVPEEVRLAADQGRFKVAGNCIELGLWNAEFGVSMVRAKKCLMAEIVVDGSFGDMEYKYAYFDGRGELVWEPGENRQLPATREALLEMSDRWRRD
ncbi:protein trichome birefringence-like 5 [Gracilaria domingensis]|nr:protein trichome birefringence-like 5 [Gracilaria domingensis]